MPDTPANPIPSEHPHDGTLSPCTLTDWAFTRYHTRGKSEYAVVYGTVAQDGSGRFAAGSRIRTSPVTLWAAPLAHTHNSVYCLPEGAGCFCDLPATLQPAKTVWVLTLQKRPLSCKTPLCSLHIPCLKPPVSAFR